MSSFVKRIQPDETLVPQLWRGIYAEPKGRQMVLQALPIARVGYGAQRTAKDRIF